MNTPEPIVCLHLFSSSSLGGTEVICAQALGALDPQRFRHHVVFLDTPGPAVPRYETFAASVRCLRVGEKSRLGLLGHLPALQKIAAATHPRLVLAYGFKTNLLWRLARWRYPAPRQPVYGLMLRGLKPMDNPTALSVVLDKLTFGAVDVVIANSQAALKGLAQAGYHLPCTAVAYNGLDLTPFISQLPKPALRGALGLEPEAFYVLCVANLRPVKNHPLLIRAFGRLAAQHPAARLLLAGQETPALAGLKQQAADLGLAGKISFLGSRTDIPALLAASDLFVLSSDHEGMQVSVMEAMAAGLPVVATAGGGTPELVVAGETGLLVKPGDEAALAAAMVRYAVSPELRQQHGAAGQQRVRQHFSLSAMARLWTEALERAAGPYPPCLPPT